MDHPKLENTVGSAGVARRVGDTDSQLASSGGFSPWGAASSAKTSPKVITANSPFYSALSLDQLRQECRSKQLEGRRVEVWWDGEQEWFAGTVLRCDPAGQIFGRGIAIEVEYDDDETLIEELNSGSSPIRFANEAPPQSALASSSKPRSVGGQLVASDVSESQFMAALEEHDGCYQIPCVYGCTPVLCAHTAAHGVLSLRLSGVRSKLFHTIKSLGLKWHGYNQKWAKQIIDKMSTQKFLCTCCGKCFDTQQQLGGHRRHGCAINESAKTAGVKTTAEVRRRTGLGSTSPRRQGLGASAMMFVVGEHIPMETLAKFRDWTGSGVSASTMRSYALRLIVFASACSVSYEN